MKLVSILASDQQRLGVLDGNHPGQLLCPPLADFPQDLEGLLDVPDAVDRLARMVNDDPTDMDVFLWEDVHVSAPLRYIEKLICIGKNYSEHALEMGGTPPEIPVIFSKFPSAIIGPGEPIRLPAISKAVDFEAELVAVIGKTGKNIPSESALDHVFGYCCGNDVTARDWQKGKPGGQWLLGKTFDTFAPLGPFVATKDEIDDPKDLGIQLRLNGELMQDSNTKNQIFPLNQLISHVSQFVTLAPGDLIFTGTPSGVGAGRKPPVFLQPGDRLEVEIDGLGVLSNPVLADS